jgi:hypothetical protein
MFQRMMRRFKIIKYFTPILIKHSLRVLHVPHHIKFDKIKNNIITYKRFNINSISNVNLNTLFVHACYDGNEKAVIYLLSQERLNPCCDHNIALKSAIENNHVNIIKLLLNDPRMNIENPIDLLIKLNNEDIFKLLFNHSKIPIDNSLKYYILCTKT